MKIAIAQLNPIVGDLSGNAAKIRQAAERAIQDGAQLLVLSELAICGYPPKDMLLRDGFVTACDRAVNALAEISTDQFGILIGHPTERGLTGGRIGNAASLLFDGRVTSTVLKVLLPNYDVFDEVRYFQKGDDVAPIDFMGEKLGVHICEDAWFGEPETFYHIPPSQQPNAVQELAALGADVLINLSASPFEMEKQQRRLGIMQRHVHSAKKPFIFVNQVGGNDDLVFDGHSFVLNEDGEEVLALASFEEDFAVVDMAHLPEPTGAEPHRSEAQMLDALTLGLRDYMGKCGFTDCVLGLSGGIDSALAACIAARAVGAANVHGILMPSRYSSDHSVDDANALAKNLGMDAMTIPIDAVHRSYETLPFVDGDLSSAPAGLADQNLQARIRGAIVMTRSNRRGWMPLATGNKSEIAVGYCTLYGDMCGGFAVLSDLYKRDVYSLSRYINEIEGREIVPVNIIDKAPSAELAPDQFDQDTLPPYPILDAVLHGLIDEERSPSDLAKEYPAATVQWVVRRLDRNEFKRRQLAPGIKLSERAFGSGRRMPMAARGFDSIEP